MDYEELREEKKILNEKITVLRERLGIWKGCSLQTKLPPHIVNDPLFKRYKRFCAEIRELDLKLSKAPKPKEKYAKQIAFMNAVEETYPEIFNEIMKKISEAA